MDPQKLHSLRHPNVPFTASQWSEGQTLHVAAVYSNPVRWRTRRQLFLDFRRHMESCPNVRLYVGEIAYGERPFEVTRPDHPYDFQFRSTHELWHKENLINLVVQRFAPDWQYGAYVDGDVVMTRYDWALESIHLLQHYDWLQLFSHYCDLGPKHEPLRITPSFMQRWTTGDLTREESKRLYRGEPYVVGDGPAKRPGAAATGLAWAFRRNSFEACGGLLDTCVVGSGDWHMAFGLIGLPDEHPQTPELQHCGRAYAESIRIWQNRASRAVRGNVGVLDCLAVHHYHGRKDQRGYSWRWQILRDNDFDPRQDIFRDYQGLWQLHDHKPQLRDAIRAYFRGRNEDV
jgi:hypothetical protein